MGKQRIQKDPATIDNEGITLQRQGRHREATELHRKAIRLNPRYAPAHHNLGNALLELGDFNGARASFEHALELAPQLCASRNGLGVAAHRLGDLDSSITHFRSAVECNPNFGEAANNLGIALRERGDMDEALTWLARAVECEPRSGRYLRHVVDTETITADSPYVEKVEALAAISSELLPESRIEALFAHGKVMLDLGRIDEAFGALNAANALKRLNVAYDEKAMLGSFEALAHTFTRELLDAVTPCGNPSDRPIFIVGMPRSGTTLVETMLAAHRDVSGGGEMTAVERAIGEMPPVAANSTIGELRAAIHGFGSRYLELTDERASGATRLTDKMPFNFRFVALIALGLPNARIIHIRRNPLDVALSCYATYFVDNVPFSYDLAELGRYYRGYERLMNAWKAVLAPGTMLELSYEDLVTNFEANARNALEFCNLEWDPSVLEFHRFRHPVRSASQSQVRRPLYTSSVNRAERSLPYLQPFLDALNG